ncbi:30S ribosomal protein S17e [archaeon]|nr:30S ribosomal protein S17e [archaeon]
MGNIRTKDIKKISFDFVETYPDKFSGDFEQNKASLVELDLKTTKLTRNKVAGYITRIKVRKSR